MTAKLLYLCNRCRPDIKTAVDFFCTRVHEPLEEDWRKLKRTLGYIYGTIDMTRKIKCDKINTLFTWVDAAYAVWNNMRSQTGGCMSFGQGMIHCRSNKQKLNTKSSTESEIVGVLDYIPYNLWLVNFMKEQGYTIKTNVVFQDNQSAIKMEKNGRNSCTGKSRHIDIRYFFTKDRVDKGEIEIKYAPSHLMVADYFTKPLQGNNFKIFRDIVMGNSDINDVIGDLKLSHAMKERVDKYIENYKNVSENKNSKIQKENSYADIVRGKKTLTQI